MLHLPRKSIVAVILITTSILASACSNEEEESKSENTDQQHQQHVVSDLREETKSVDVLPEFLKDKPEDMKLIYAAVAQNQELLEKIPCYCGCGEEANHKNNYDCFVFENKDNGAVVWDDHGTKCGVCLETAAQSVLDYSKGKSVKEIRTIIDEKYKDGYAEPTPTPEV